jgi:hypothetical protein
MGDKLVIEGDLLANTQKNLQSILTEFEGAEQFSEYVASLTGHSRLEGEVREFASSWNIKRAEVIESVTALKESIGAINEAFDNLDSDLATALADTAGSIPAVPGIPEAS